MNINYCGNCKYIKPTEDEQTKMKIKPNHFCKKYKKVVLHRGKYPELPILDECKNNLSGGKND